MKVPYYKAFIYKFCKVISMALVALTLSSYCAYSSIGSPADGTYVKNSITVTSYWGSISRDYNFWIYLYKKNMSTGVQTQVASQNCVHTTPSGTIGIPEGPGSVAWNVAVTFGADGNWQLIQTDSRASGSSVVNVIVDSTFPVVTVNAPNGGEQYYCGQVENLTWTATDNIGFPANPVSVYFSADNGTNWLLITREANTGSYKFVSPPVPTTTAKVRMVFSDLAGNLVTKESASVFTLRPFLSDMYVSPAPTGSDDTGNGTSAAPFRTLQRGLTNVADNGTVHATGAKYYEKDIIWPPQNYVLLKNEGPGVTIDAAGLGSGISVPGGRTLTIEGVTFQNCKSAYSGAAVRIDQGNTLDLNKCTFINCSSDASGGAVYSNSYSYINAKDCRFISNTANTGGAVKGYMLNFINCIFNNNYSSKEGGAIVVWRDSSDTGTAVGEGHAHAVNCTFNNNTSSTSGNTIYNNGYGFYGTNCIIWGSDVPFFGGPYDFKNSDIQSASWSFQTTNCFSVNPQFKNSDLELSETSPCIDTATVETGVPVKDILGATRSTSVNERFDIGAYEFPYAGVGKIHNMTKSNNYPTIFSALWDAGAGNKIIIENGRYRETLAFWPNYNDITLTAVNTSTWEAVEINGEDLYPVMDFTKTSASVRGTIEGLTLMNGLSVNGGGIGLPNNSNIIVKRCYIKDSKATNNGGGLYNGKAINCVFENNTATNNGGGTYNVPAESCIFTNNRAETGNGGGMFGGPANLCTFTQNSSYNGGGLYGSNAYKCVFESNSGGNYGGGISTGEAYDCQFNGNTASYGGGASNVKLDRCVFNSNSGSGSVYISDKNRTIQNCLLYSNSGYGIYVDIPVGQTFKILNCTIDQSTPVYTNNDKTQIKNCIVRGGAIAKGVTGYYDSLSYSNFEVMPSIGTANISTPPQFTDPSNGNYKLLAASPSINSGSNDTDCTTMDVIGKARVNGTKIDMGAYEYYDGTVAIVLPTTGETLQYGGTYDISWEVYDYTGGPSIAAITHLKYSLDGGLTWNNMASGANLSPDKYYTWTVPSIDTNQCIIAVEIERIAGTLISSSKSGMVSIHEKLVKLTSPVSGDAVVAGSPYTIKWAVQDIQGNDVDADITHLRYSVDSGATWTALNGGENLSPERSFEWTSPIIATSDCWIAVDIARSNGVIINTSEVHGVNIVDNNKPTITITADKQDLNAAGTTISWTATDEIFGTSTPVRLYLSNDNGNTWAQINAPQLRPVSGTYNYVPAVTGYMPLGKYQIKAVATDSSNNSAEAIVQFAIDTEAPTMEITATARPSSTDPVYIVTPYDLYKVDHINVIPGEKAELTTYSTDSATAVTLQIKPARFGLHAVTFEVWDICGNMSRKIVMVEVIRSDMPVISNVASDGRVLAKETPNIGDKPVLLADIQDFHENLDPANTYFIVKNGNIEMKVPSTITQDPSDNTLYTISANPTLPGHGTYHIFIVATDLNGYVATWESSSIRSLNVMSVSLKKPKTIPNPFNPRKDGETAIVYKLSTDMNIVISIYDMTQKQVWSQSFSRGENGGLGDPAENRVMWNGKNSSGVPVGNGVYIFIIRSGQKVISQGQMLIIN
jgi:hypothetical protein